MAISKRRNSVGMTGSMQMVDSKEIQKSVDEYLDKDNVKNRGERKRLSEKFYRQWWGCLETCCGHCGTVYRLPRMIDKKETTVETIFTFFSQTQHAGCPCCEKPIHELMPVDPKIYLERREMTVLGLRVLKIIADNPLPIPSPKIEIEE